MVVIMLINMIVTNKTLMLVVRERRARIDIGGRENKRVSRPKERSVDRGSTFAISFL